MRILLVSEGKHEQSGALETLVRRVCPGIVACDQDRVSRCDIHTHRGRGQGFFKRAVRWLHEAKKRGYDALVLVIDEDGESQRVQELDQAQQYRGTELARAFGLAIRTFDAWMLADERALSQVLDFPVTRQALPETLKAPKEVCSDLLASSTCDCTQSELYASVAERLDLALLRERCPRGFGVLATRLEPME